MKFFAVGLLLFFAEALSAQSFDGTVIKDLKEDWKQFERNRYQEYDPSKDARFIYFLVEDNHYKGTALRVESQKQFSLFLAGKLIDSSRKGILFYDLDSLSVLYSAPMQFSILMPGVDISTALVLRNTVELKNSDLGNRNDHYFLDFSIMGSIILLTFLVILLRTNPKLTFDYLNFAKLFSIQEREENIMAIRITSSINLLFYTFASFLTAFLLIVVLHFAHAELSLANNFRVNSLMESFLQWLKLSAFILCILFGKLILIGALSYLYKATEITALQFFNFIRLFFFTFGVVSLLMMFYFMGQVQDSSWYYNLFYVAAGIFLFWEIIIFLKLMSRLPFRIFHLFFYLCASELIPLVILIKVVFY